MSTMLDLFIPALPLEADRYVGRTTAALPPDIERMGWNTLKPGSIYRVVSTTDEVIILEGIAGDVNSVPLNYYASPWYMAIAATASA